MTDLIAPQVGLEPTTTRLTAECSAIELLRIMESGSDLSSRAVSSQVLSALESLTSVFGMGTGVPKTQSTPTIYLSSGFCPRTFIIIPPLDSLVKRFFGDPSGIRTHVNGVRGRCLNHLTMGPWCTFTDSNRGPTD